MPRRTQPSWVYFVRRADGVGPVKIGCTQAPRDRLAALMAWAPYPLTIAASIAGDEELERRFHSRFIHLHSHCEWFLPAPELEEAVQQVAAGAFDVATLPEPSRLPPMRPRTAESFRAAGMSRRLTALKRRGILIPPHVEAARWTYRCAPDEKARRRAIVREFVLQHTSAA